MTPDLLYNKKLNRWEVHYSIADPKVSGVKYMAICGRHSGIRAKHLVTVLGTIMVAGYIFMMRNVL